MCANCEKSDLSLLTPVFEAFAGDDHALISILQKAQDIYGYLPTDVLYAIAEKTGNSPAKVMGVATFYTQFRLSEHTAAPSLSDLVENRGVFSAKEALLVAAGVAEALAYVGTLAPLVIRNMQISAAAKLPLPTALPAQGRTAPAVRRD